MELFSKRKKKNLNNEVPREVQEDLALQGHLVAHQEVLKEDRQEALREVVHLVALREAVHLEVQREVVHLEVQRKADLLAVRKVGLQKAAHQVALREAVLQKDLAEAHHADYE